MIMDIKALKELSSDAFKAYVEFLVEDCTDEFTILSNGDIIVNREDDTRSGCLRWKPFRRHGKWQSLALEDE